MISLSLCCQLFLSLCLLLSIWMPSQLHNRTADRCQLFLCMSLPPHLKFRNYSSNTHRQSSLWLWWEIKQQWWTTARNGSSSFSLLCSSWHVVGSVSLKLSHRTKLMLHNLTWPRITHFSHSQLFSILGKTSIFRFRLTVEYHFKDKVLFQFLKVISERTVEI